MVFNNFKAFGKKRKGGRARTVGRRDEDIDGSS